MKRIGQYAGEKKSIERRRIEEVTQRIKASAATSSIHIERNLFLRADPKTGVRYWIFRYQQGKRQRPMSLGRYGSVSVAQALRDADQCREWLHQKRDPIEVRKYEKERAISETEGTFKNVYDQWLERNAPEWSLRNYKRHVSVIRRCLMPRLASKLVKDIDIPLMRSVLEEAQAKRGIITALEARSSAISLWRFAIAAGVCPPVNPARDLDAVLKRRPRPKHHEALPLDKLGEFLRALHASGRTPVTKLALRFLILTGVRVNSLRLALWQEFDLKSDPPTWSIPAAHMKTRQAFCLPLSSQAVDVLKQMRAFDYVDSRTFFGGGEGNMLSGASLSHVIRELGFGGTCHGFRSLLFSWALEQGYPHDVADTQLAHAIGSQTSRSYSGASRDGKRLLADFMEQRARMMQHWGDVVEVAEAGKPLDVGGNVVKLKRARQGI